MDAERKRLWWDRAWALGLLLLGAFLAQGLEYWRTFTYISSDIRGYVLSPTIFNDNVNIQLAFVNKGNHQGAVVGVQLVLPFDAQAGLGKGHLGQRPNDFSVSGAPVVLNPGEIRLVTLKGKLNPETVASLAKLVDPKADDGDASKPDRRKQDLEIRLRSLDFRGGKYETYWPIGSVYVSNKRIDGYRLPAQYNGTELRPFDEKGYVNSWVSEDAIISSTDGDVKDGRSSAPAPESPHQ